MHIPLVFLSPHDSLHVLSNQFLYALLATTNLFSTPAPSRSRNRNTTDGHGLAYAGNARAFIIAERPEHNSSERTLLLNVDIAMRYLGVRRELLLALAEEYGNTTYHADNVALVGTHQHSGVHGYLESGWRVA
ncbi:hypothetical protein B0H14DRAFT_3430856 [Mycena olivaceomarginata]|nr:hypothetical protein B0H14DRAFT_3430856 [Mycena olivaceomarginata]